MLGPRNELQHATRLMRNRWKSKKTCEQGNRGKYPSPNTTGKLSIYMERSMENTVERGSIISGGKPTSFGASRMIPKRLKFRSHPIFPRRLLCPVC
jgi:hypothetical protein